METLQIPDSLIDVGTRQKQQLENLLSILDAQPQHLDRYHDFDPRNNILAVLRTPEYLGSGKYDMIANFYYTHNLVGNDGDIFYAKLGAGEVPSANEDFENGRMELNNPAGADTLAKTDDYSDVLTPITASRKVFDGSYPRTNDPDGDNTGAGVDVATYLTSYTTGDFNANGINGGAVLDDLTTPATSAKLLTHYSITAFNKTASDTLKMFVNHTMNGVP